MIGLKLLGRMGNHLFEYSFLRIVGEHNNLEWKIINPTFENDYWAHRGMWQADTFLSCQIEFAPTHQFQYEYKDVNDVIGYGQNKFLIHDIGSIKNDTLLRGIFQSGDLISKINPQWFRVKNIDHKLSYSVESSCFVHFRGIDYIPYYFEKYSKTNDFISYYEQAKKVMDAKCGRKMDYIVITDDLENARRFVKADHYVINSAEEAFFDFSLAKYSIIPVSTFSWWACFLSSQRDICIAPSGWMFYAFDKQIKSSWCYTDKFTWI